MILKGHTTIELTNVETGEKEVVDESNMITNGIAKVLEYLPTETNPPLSKLLVNRGDSVESGPIGLKRSIKMLTGGLLLFDSSLDENVDNIIPASGISTIGCASGVAYTGTNVMAGSYNDSESGEVENGYKHVWDFGTSQANGQIACVCLTTREGGYTASGTYPFDSNYIFSTYSNKGAVPDDNDQLSLRSGFAQARMDDSGIMRPFDTLYADYDKGEVIAFSDSYEWFNVGHYSGTADDNFKKTFLYKKSISLSRKRIMLKDYSIFDKNRMSSTSDKLNPPSSGYGTNIIETVKVEMPLSLSTVIDRYMESSGYFFVEFSSDEGYIYISIYKASGISNSCITLPINDTLHIWKINANDFTSEHIELPNLTGKDLRCKVDCGITSKLYVTNDCVIAVTMDGYIYSLELSSPKATQITYPDGTPFVFSNVGNNNNILYMAYAIKGKLYCCLDNKPMVIDTKSNKISYRNILLASEQPSYNHARVYVQHSNGHILSEYLYTYNRIINCYYGLKTLPELLLTINNLVSPVTKTASQTMKVTYTLTAVKET